MPNYSPDEHPEAQWLWPWSKEQTRDFFAGLQAGQQLIPGPEPELALLQYIVICQDELTDELARDNIALLAVIHGLPPLKPEDRQKVTATTIQLGPLTAACIQITVAVVPADPAADRQPNLAGMTPVLPAGQPQPPSDYSLEQTEDGYVLRPDWQQPSPPDPAV